MFTGIITAQGTVDEISSADGDRRVRIDSGSLSLADCREGDSISVSGVCLTMLELDGNGFCADISRETLDLTTLGNLGVGSQVNLELALALSDRLGGHMVSGHVDGKGRLVSRRADARAERFEFELPPTLLRYVARKGSVCINGVSLTVNEVTTEEFSVCLIPHTLQLTTLGLLQPGDEVNIEVDLIARYLERLVNAEVGDDELSGSAELFEG
jgi:riboflavin synthase